jgi:hypothetical protein
MSGRRGRPDRAVARLLFADHLPLLLLVWAAYAVAVAGVTIGIAAFGTVGASVWDRAAALLRWLALGYGAHLTYTLLPSFVAHGRTRREFSVQAAAFLVVAVAVLAVLMALGYALEAVVYRAMAWPQELSPARLYASAGQVPLIVLTFVVVFAVWTVAGALLAAGFYRDDGSALLAIPVALLMVTLAGIGVGYGGLPLADRLLGIDGDGLGVPGVALAAGAFVVAVALTWALVRDLPVRTRPR